MSLNPTYFTRFLGRGDTISFEVKSYVPHGDDEGFHVLTINISGGSIVTFHLPYIPTDAVDTDSMIAAAIKLGNIASDLS